MLSPSDKGKERGRLNLQWLVVVVVGVVVEGGGGVHPSLSIEKEDIIMSK